MTTTTTFSRAATPAHRGVLPLGMRRILFEIKLYFRAGDQVFFSFLFPVMMYAIFATVFSGMGAIGGGPNGEGSITAAAYYLPGLIAGAILVSGVQTLGIDIATEKGDGTLKRLGGTPLSPLSYFLGKIGLVVLTSLLQIGMLLALAHFAFDVTLPTTASAWATASWVYVLGILCCAVLGVAVSALPRSGKSAAAVVIPIVLIPQFISGVYVQFTMLPEWLQNVANLLPLAWIARGMRAAFLPDAFAAAEAGGAWNLGVAALVIGGWCVVGLVLARLTFRWIRTDG